jgi:hypothetical protein
MKKNFTLFPLCVLLIFSLSASAQTNTAVSLNGSTSYIAGTTGIDVVPAINDFSVEFWVYLPTLLTSGQHYFVFQGSEGGNPFAVGYDGPTGNITVGEDFSSPTVIVNTGIKLPVAQWVHIAVVTKYDHLNAVDSSTLYLNGILQTTFAIFYAADIGGSTIFQIGAQDPGSGPTEFANGKIDELRIWGDPTLATPSLGWRTPAQLRSGLLGVDPSSPGLLAYYNMNDNTSGTTVKNVTTNGTPSNYDATWVTGKSWLGSPIQASLNAINLNGSTSDLITVPNNAAYDLTTGGTIEMWIYPTSLSSNNSTLVANRDPGSAATRYSYHINNGAFSFWNGGSFTFFNYATPTLLNVWSHLAFVYNPAALPTPTTTVYLNGAVIGTLTESFGATTGLPFVIGNDANNVSTESFTGTIDEVSIWSTQQNAAQITVSMNTPPTGNESGIISLFSFNQGIPSGDNTGLSTVLDNNITTSNHGKTSASMVLSGGASNFILSTITPLPVNFTTFTATAQDYQALLQWQTAQEQNSRDYTIERSPDGIHYSAIGSVPAAGNSSLPSNYSFVDPAPLNGPNYYRLKESDLDGKFMYSGIRTLNFSLGSGQKLVWFQTGEKAVEVDLRPGSNELYTVTDIGGRAIQQGQLSSGKLYLSQLPAGLYVIQVITNTGTKLNTKVLVK